MTEGEIFTGKGRGMKKVKKYRYANSVFLSVIFVLSAYFASALVLSFYPQFKRTVEPIIARILSKPYNKYHLSTLAMFND